jgi:hypothetical protein
MRYFVIPFSLMVLIGCAHPIIITPELQSLKIMEAHDIQATAGYYISPTDRENYVYSPGGGGDRIYYYPYKELEPALQKVLFTVFKDVKRLDLTITPDYLKANNISFAFLPEITTDSYSDGLFTWPPTSFTVNVSCKAFSQNGKLIWERKYTGVGTATFSEFKQDFGLAAKRASQKVFAEMLDDLSKAGEFRN